MLKRLRSSLFASFCAVAILGLAVFVLFAAPRIKNTALDQIEGELKEQISITGPDILALLERRAPGPLIQNEALKLSSLSGNRVTVVSIGGKVIADSATPIEKLGELENHKDRPEIIDASRSGFGRSVRHSATVKQDLIYVAEELKGANGKPIAYLRFSVPTTYADDFVMKMYKAVLAAAAASIIFAIILSIIFSRTFADPIIRLSEITKKISQGQFPQVIVRKSKFEVGDLEKNIEDMSINLAAMFKDLSDERTRASAILNSMAEGVLAADSIGRVILANPVIEKVFGVIEPMILGQTVREAVKNNEIADIFEEARRSGKAIEKEISVLTPMERTFIAQAAPMRSAEGEQGIVCVLYDITELRRLERYRSEFVANVSHELKTPLTAIRGYVETLLDGAVNDKQHNIEFLQKIDKHVLNLSSLIDDVLEISRLESKRETGKSSRVDIGQLALRAIETVSGKAKKKGLAIVNDRAGAGCFVEGIEDQIYRAILNLMDNAVNYTPEGGRISVSCTKNEGSVEMSVTDTGIGIAEEHLPRIFERFYRVDKGRSRDMGGTGLGLAIVKHVMNLHNGSVSVESQEGKGSRFTLVFPAAKA